MIPGEWSSDIPGVRGTIPGNSQRGVVGHQFPRRWQRRSWRSGITPDTGVGVVLEAWCYTRVAGTEVIHVAATGFQGIPDCVARYKFPQNVATTGSISTAARGVDIKGLRHQYQGSVGDGSDWNTGVPSSHGVINLHFVYTLVTVFSLFINSATVCLFIPSHRFVYSTVTLVTPMPTRR